MTPKLVEGKGATASRRSVAALFTSKGDDSMARQAGHRKPAKLGMAYWFAINEL